MSKNEQTLFTLRKIQAAAQKLFLSLRFVVFLSLLLVFAVFKYVCIVLFLYIYPFYYYCLSFGVFLSLFVFDIFKFV